MPSGLQTCATLTQGSVQMSAQEASKRLRSSALSHAGIARHGLIHKVIFI